MNNVYEQVDSNKRRSWVVVVLFTLVVSVAIYFISMGMSMYFGPSSAQGYGGLGIFGIALIISGLTSFVGYWYSDKIVLGLSGARLASRQRDFEFYTVAENLSLGTGLPMPKLYVIEDSAPNAFATGRDPQHAAICATTGLLSKLNRTELEGVMAHEMSHVGNYDTRLMSVVTVLVGVVVLLGDWFLRASFWGRGSASGRRDNDNEGNSGAIFIVLGLIFALLSPIVAQMIQLAISRRRELLADASSVKITRQPDGLARALIKISADREPLEAANKATAHLYIVNPFKGIHGSLDKFARLFDTHPPITERLKQLRAMGASV